MRESPKFSQNSALFIGGNMCTNLLGTPNVFLTTHTLGSFPGILAMQGSKALSGSQHSDFTTFAWGIQDGNPAPKTSRGGPSCWVNSRWFNRPLLKVAYFLKQDFLFHIPVGGCGWMDLRKKSGRNRNRFKNPFLVASSCWKILIQYIYNILNNWVA